MLANKSVKVNTKKALLNVLCSPTSHCLTSNISLIMESPVARAKQSNVAVSLLDLDEVLLEKINRFRRRSTERQMRREKRQSILYSTKVNGLNVAGWLLIPLPLAGQYVTCPSCRRQISSVSNYCNSCGALLRPQLVLKICPNCKRKITVSSRFCSECGQKLIVDRTRARNRGTGQA
jgi:hypothetical protein